MTIYNLGSINVDHVYRLPHMPVPGETMASRDYAQGLGGKGANLVFADADDKAVQRGVRHMMNNSGQSCNAPSRMLVERSAYDRAVEIAAREASEITVDPASQEGKHIGPVVNKRQWEQIQSYIQ